MTDGNRGEEGTGRSREADNGRLARAGIVAAARDVLDEGGVDGLTMARVGERLGVTAMALYRHVADRRELEHAAVELVFADLDLAAVPGLDWAEAVARWMREVRAHLLQHPWVTGLMGTGHALSPAWLAALDQLVVVLGRAGIDPSEAAREVTLVARTTVGITLQEIAAPLPHAAGDGPALLAGLAPDAVSRWEPLLPGLAAYTNDELFDDVVADAVHRLERVAHPDLV